jgi:hypothetical protein
MSMPGKFTIEQVKSWLFAGKSIAGFPRSKLVVRNQVAQKPVISTDKLKPIGEGRYTSRVIIYSGGITDICIERGKTGAVASSNNGDLLTGCGYAVAKAVINAAGAGMQTELYNRYGVPQVMQVPKRSAHKYAATEGRGYAVTCESYDMAKTHNVEQIEELTVPIDNTPRNREGVINMYYEAFVHCRDLDYILLPMAGMTHRVIDGSDTSAMLANEAFFRFIKAYPDSKLKVVFTIFKALKPRMIIEDTRNRRTLLLMMRQENRRVL